MDLISLLVTVLIAGLIFWLVWFVVHRLPIPEPFRTVAIVIVAIIAVLYLISLLTGGVSLPKLRIN